MTSPRDEALIRSGGRCEAMILVAHQFDGREVWARCFDRPVEVHHALTRSRGGKILDAAGESGHLICLCHHHHRSADGGDAYDGGLLKDGYVTYENGEIVYYGSDEYLKEKYGKRDKAGEGEESADHDAAREVAEAAGPPEEVERSGSGIRGQGTLW